MLFRLFVLIIFSLWFELPAVAGEAPHYTQARILSSVQGVDHLKTIQIGVEVKLEARYCLILSKNVLDVP